MTTPTGADAARETLARITRDSSRVTTIVRALRTAENEFRAAYVAAESIEDAADRAKLNDALSAESSRVRHLREAVALGGVPDASTVEPGVWRMAVTLAHDTGRVTLTVAVPDANGINDAAHRAARMACTAEGAPFRSVRTVALVYPDGTTAPPVLMQS